MTANDLSGDSALQFLTLPGALSIAFRKLSGRSPGVIFLPGFGSDMEGAKARHLADWAKDRSQAFVRFDYFGHGASSGNFDQGTIGHWGNDALAILDAVADPGPQILVGSSMGGWLMLRVAQSRPERIAGLIGLAAAPDFTEDLIWDQLGPAERQKLIEEGLIEQPSDYGQPYRITRQLIEEGREHLLLRAPIQLAMPLRLLHGLEDADVPWQRAIDLIDAYEGRDARLNLIKGGDHRLSRDEDLALLCDTLEALIHEVS